MSRSLLTDQGPISARPAAGAEGRFWWATDEGVAYIDRGTEWERVPVGPLEPRTYQDEVLADSPLGYWRMEHSSGDAPDSSGNGRSLTEQGTPLTGQAGRVGSAVHFDTAADYYIRDYESSWMESIRTWETWVKVPDIATNSSGQLHRSLIARRQAFNESFWFRIGVGASNPSGELRLLFPTSSSGNVHVTSTTEVDDDQWHHCVGTYDGSNLRIYVDGVHEGTTAHSGGYDSSTAHLRLARLHNDDTEWLDGLMDETALYDYDLSLERIQAHYNAGVAA